MKGHTHTGSLDEVVGESVRFSANNEKKIEGKTARKIARTATHTMVFSQMSSQVLLFLGSFLTSSHVRARPTLSSTNIFLAGNKQMPYICTFILSLTCFILLLPSLRRLLADVGQYQYCRSFSLGCTSRLSLPPWLPSYSGTSYASTDVDVCLIKCVRRVDSPMIMALRCVMPSSRTRSTTNFYNENVQIKEHDGRVTRAVMHLLYVFTVGELHQILENGTTRKYYILRTSIHSV
eukprot:scaffold6952_cov48-Attheya_sp.AAC.3